MRRLGVSLAAAVAVTALVYLASAGHVFFLPLVLLPFGMALGSRRDTHRRRRLVPMSTYDDRDTAMARDPYAQQQVPPPQQQPYYGYGYGMRPFRRSGMNRGGGWSETKPFFMTSEFLMTVIGILAVAITAASASDIDSRLGISLIAGLIAAYTLSRGVAKSGTRSRATDPRDELDLSRTPERARQHAEG